jgi:hypothetical protein
MRKLGWLFVLSALAAVAPARAAAPAAAAAAASPGPQAVVALIDTGINPYAPAFRDTSPLASRYPATYLPGYPPPCDGTNVGNCAEELRLTLDRPAGFDGTWDLRAALARDAEQWSLVELLGRNQLYWVPGTKIVGLISMSAGGVSCGTTPPVPPADQLVNLGCKDHVLLDDAGHGTMTASRATGVAHSLGTDARVVEVEGTGANSVAWAASQPWIDVQSNSWGSLVPSQPNVTSAPDQIREAARTQMILFASGNGLGTINGFAPSPTYVESTGVPGVVLVGAHDNGYVSPWSSAPAHVAADGYGGYAAHFNSLEPMSPDPISCCTSAAAPYAAGGAAAELLAARTILGDDGSIARAPGVVAVLGANGAAPASGPLSDGQLTLAELKAVYFATAEARPALGKDDGLAVWTATGSAPQHPEHGPAENPFCIGCFTAPVRWTDVPAGAPAYADIGYGGVNERAVSLASVVLKGDMPMPARAAEDAWYAQDQQVRTAYFGS